MAIMVGFGIAVGQGVAAPNGVPGKPPIPTKSGQQASLQAATAALLADPAASPVPHYFGPWPNWANSPFALADAPVTIGAPDVLGGIQATATATVGAQGAVTAITIDNPGSGYTTLPTVTIAGAGAGATATAAVTLSPAVTSITITNPGGGYTAPQVVINDTTGSGAAATVYGGVESVSLVNAGTGYTAPTVDFSLPQWLDGVAATGHVTCDTTPDTACGLGSTITGIVIDSPGSGYTAPPTITIRDGTLADPILPGGSGAEATANSLVLQTVEMTDFGSNYSAPTVSFADLSGSGATADATVSQVGAGIVSGITVDTGGAGYVTPGMKKFVDTLPGLCDPAVAGDCAAKANNLGQYLPIAVPDTTTFPGSDYYVIAVVQQRERMSSSLPASGTLHRKYVQLMTPALATEVTSPSATALYNEALDGTKTDINLPTGVTGAVTDPRFLGPVIVAQKDRPVRVTFYNLLPTGSGGDMILPTDSTLMGAGFIPEGWRDLTDTASTDDEVRNQPCTQANKGTDCFKDNRATLHLHGGISPWISDGTPHQWITPAGEATAYPQGESVGDVPDMPNCSAPNDGCQNFYWTNQQSARLMFYHDHAFGTTRLNVYLGEAAGYLITDATEQKLVADGTIPAPTEEIPLIIQDRTFVPDANQLALADPTWDYDRWGDYGDFWYHHVYMPAQNPGDPGGMSAYGRWMYGPWFWPPAQPPYGPIDNPYFDAACDLNDPATWQYDTDPFCEPKKIPGTPNISAGMEQFNDTPIVNGTAYPTMEVDPKTYRFRVLNAANDRFFNLSLYEADPGTASADLNGLGQPIGGTEVAFKPAELAAAQLDPVVFPTPDTSVSLPGPDWVQIANEGGFLPAPVVIPLQETTWITDPTRFDVGNVDQHSLLVAPAERADVIVDFSQYAGKTLILYNDAPAAFPARVPSYDYYTGAPDQSPNGAPVILAGYGPNTRTVMQIKVRDVQPDPAFNLAALQTAFASTKAGGGGVFEKGQHPVIVGQAAYNSAYGTGFVASGNCNVPPSDPLDPADLGNTTVTKCDGLARIDDQGGTWFGFNALSTGTAGKLKIRIEPKGIHDEMNSATFDEFGRMTANMGLEAIPAVAGLQNITLYPYVNPPTELIDGTKLPKNVPGVEVTPISSAADGTQIWKITHNGVDTHPIHFHLYDVQLLNRVTWDNIIIPPDANELGWKDTVRVSPLEDTVVALRPIVPQLPFALPNSIRPLNPAMPIGATLGFNNADPQGNPTNPIFNQLVNFGWEYVWHCHILSHEEMDMMRPQSLALPPEAPTVIRLARTGGRWTMTFNDNSVAETSFQLQRTNDGATWNTVATLTSPLDLANTTATGVSLADPTSPNSGVYGYRMAAVNTVGYGAEFPSMSVQSVAPPTPLYTATANKPAAPTNLVATLATPQVNLTWRDNATNENGFYILRSTNGGAFTQAGTAPSRNNTGNVSWSDATVTPGNSYRYQVVAFNGAGSSAVSNTAGPVSVSALPTVPTNVKAANGTAGGQRTAGLTWTAVAGATSYSVLWSNSFTMTPATQVNNVTSGQQINVGNPTRTVYMQVRANNAVGSSAWAPTIAPVAVSAQ
jgi:FtsP/CotA-like multicopper oxidase with cupredoxin domain